jgi:hypothetical protein
LEYIRKSFYLWFCGSLTQREEQEFENRVLRRMFGPTRDEVTGGWRKLLLDLYSSPRIIRIITSRIMRSVRHVAIMGEEGILHFAGRKSRVKVTSRKIKTEVCVG